LDVNSYNKVILVGYVTSEVEVKKTKDAHKNFCRFQLATNEVFSDKKDRTQFHHIIAWGKTAEFCGKWLKKGRLVQADGKIRYRYWNDPQGFKRRIAEINIEQIVLLGKRKDFEAEEEEPTEEREPGIDDPL